MNFSTKEETSMRSLIVGFAALASAAVPYAFSPNTPAKASEVNANFSSLDQGVAAVAADVAGIKSQLASAVPSSSKVATADNDAAQLEDGASPATDAAKRYCSNGVCVNRLTSGPFVLTNTEQVLASQCLNPCTVDWIGSITYFPAPDDATAVAIIANTAKARWKWSSVISRYDYGTVPTGLSMRFIVKAGENLYSYHPSASDPGAPVQQGGANGHWSGYHPY